MQARGRPLPSYELIRSEGADHAKRFFVSCRLMDSGVEQEAEGGSRRKAEQTAANALLQRLEEEA